MRVRVCACVCTCLIRTSHDMFPQWNANVDKHSPPLRSLVHVSLSKVEIKEMKIES